MFEMPVEQQFLFLLYLGVFGLVIGMVFDFYLAWARVFNFSRKKIFLLDFLFCLFCAFIFFYLLFTTNRGLVRLYTFLASACGLVLYLYFGHPRLYSLFLTFFRSVKLCSEKIIKTVNFWQDLLNKKRTVYRGYYDGWKKSLWKKS